MTKGALYRHYKSKRDIFDSIVKQMEQQDSEQARENEVPEESIEKTPEEYQNVSFDDFASSFRKMLTIEQFRSEGMQKLYQQYLVSGPAGYVKDLFKNMKIKDPEENAVKFYANMFFYYNVYDGAADKAKAKCQFEQMLDKIVEESLKGAAIWDEVKDRLKSPALGLSGGQQQRVCIARTIAMKPDVILMDEPTSALDPISTSKVEELMATLKNQYTIVIVTHNMQQAARISDKTGFFLNGELIEFNNTKDIFTVPHDKRTEDYITGRFG